MNLPAPHRNKFLTDHMSRSTLVNTINRLLAAEEEREGLVSKHKNRTRRLETAFNHVHVDNGTTNYCKECGLHITDTIHRAKNEIKDISKKA